MLDFVQLYWWLIILVAIFGPISVATARPLATILRNKARSTGKDMDQLDCVHDCENLLHELRGLPLYDGLPQDMQNRTQHIIERLASTKEVSR